MNTKKFEALMKSVKTQILRKAGQTTELYLKLAIGVAPGGSGVLALNALSKGDYAEPSLEVFFLIPWLRFAGGRLNHITIVARNGDEVVVNRQAVEAWQQGVYNGGEAGLKRAEGLGQALKTGGRNADEVLDAVGCAGINGAVVGDLFDFTQTAVRLPGARWKNLEQLRDYLLRQTYLSKDGVGLIATADSILDSMGIGKNAACAVRDGRPYILLRLRTTNREVLHELGHMLTHKSLGDAAYRALAEPVREHFAATFVRSRRFYSRMTPEEHWQELAKIDPAFTPNDAIRQLLRRWGALLE